MIITIATIITICFGVLVHCLFLVMSIREINRKHRRNIAYDGWYFYKKRKPKWGQEVIAYQNYGGYIHWLSWGPGCGENALFWIPVSKIRGWIPVEAQLPQEDKNVLILNENEEIERDWFVDGKFRWANERVLYWRPLPNLPVDEAMLLFRHGRKVR